MPRKPTACLVKEPTTQSVQFCGRFINLTRVQEKTGLSQSMLSYVFLGSRAPSQDSAKKIATALGYPTPGGFLDALEEHVIWVKAGRP